MKQNYDLNWERRYLYNIAPLLPAGPAPPPPAPGSLRGLFLASQVADHWKGTGKATAPHTRSLAFPWWLGPGK